MKLHWMTLLICLLTAWGCSEPSQTITTSGTSDTSAKPTRTLPESVTGNAGFTFAGPIRLEANDAPISVEAPGYACPTVADVDRDGKLDLVVGQFNQGAMQFFKNIAAEDEAPQLAAAEWLQTDGERAIVPGVW